MSFYLQSKSIQYKIPIYEYMTMCILTSECITVLFIIILTMCLNRYNIIISIPKQINNIIL